LKSVEIAKVPGPDGVTHKVLLAGVFGGVFRAFDPQVLNNIVPEWTEFGRDLPRVLVTDVHYDDHDKVLVIGNFGRGAWMVQYADSSLGRPGVVQIDGGNTNDAVTLIRDPQNARYLEFFVNKPTTQTPDLRIPLGAIDTIQVIGNAGDDTLLVDMSQGLINIPGGIHFVGGNQATAKGDLVFLSAPAVNHFAPYQRDQPSPAGPRQFVLLGPVTTYVFSDEQTVVYEQVETLQTANIPFSEFDVFGQGLQALADHTRGLRSSGLIPYTPVLAGFFRGLDGETETEPKANRDPVQGAGAESEEAITGGANSLIRRLLEEGLGGFRIEDIGTTITTAEDLRAALDGLDDQAGNVTFTVSAEGVTRYDVTVVKVLDGAADLDVEALGGLVELNGSVDFSATITLHILFGVDATGFFIEADGAQDADGNPIPELVVSNITRDIEGFGRVGFLAVTLTDGTVTFAPGVSLSVDLLDPGTDQGDGLIRLSELEAITSDLVAVNLEGDPGQDDVSFNGTFHVAAFNFDLADLTLGLRWPDVNQISGIQINASATLGKFLNVDSDEVVSGIQSLAGLFQQVTGKDILATNIPLINKSL
jgi:hypothetical protein